MTRPDPTLRLRKVQIATERIYHAGGPELDRPGWRGWIAAVAENPFAGTHAAELGDFMAELDGLARDLAVELRDALLARADAIEGYGKGAIVGVGGEFEMAAAWHVPGGAGLRAALGGPKAMVPSSKKVGPMGCQLDIPTHHLHASYLRSHYDAVPVVVGDGPAPNEVVYALAMTTGERPHARIGGFTSPPHDFDAAPSDFLRIAPASVGVHGRMLHLVDYQHQLAQRADNFHLLEEVVHCMANNAADVVGQVGTNWSHAGGSTASDIRAFCDRMEDTYGIPLHMAGMCLVEAARSLGVERVALNAVYFWPEWRDGLVRFLRSAELDVVFAGNFVDLGLFESQRWVNDQHWIFPGEAALESVRRTANAAPQAEAILVCGMPNFRDGSGVPRRIVHRVGELEAAVGKPIIASDTALYWAIFRSLGIAPEVADGRLLGEL